MKGATGRYLNFCFKCIDSIIVDDLYYKLKLNLSKTLKIFLATKKTNDHGDNEFYIFISFKRASQIPMLEVCAMEPILSNCTFDVMLKYVLSMGVIYIDYSKDTKINTNDIYNKIQTSINNEVNANNIENNSIHLNQNINLNSIDHEKNNINIEKNSNSSNDNNITLSNTEENNNSKINERNNKNVIDKNKKSVWYKNNNKLSKDKLRQKKRYNIEFLNNSLIDDIDLQYEKSFHSDDDTKESNSKNKPGYKYRYKLNNHEIK